MPRPSLDTPRGALGPRYLTPALVAPPQTARVYLRATPREPRDLAYIAAELATGFRPGDADDPRMVAAVAAIRREALTAAPALRATMRNDLVAACVDNAVALQRAIMASPEAERACLGVAVVRALLDDAPDRCVDLDRAVRDAARVHLHAVTAEHAATAARMVAVVLA